MKQKYNTKELPLGEYTKSIILLKDEEEFYHDIHNHKILIGPAKIVIERFPDGKIHITYENLQLNNN
jgi:hypothetical protein